MKELKNYQIKQEKLNTFQWYVDSLEYLKWFRIDTKDFETLDEALAMIQTILDKFETN